MLIGEILPSNFEDEERVKGIRSFDVGNGSKGLMVNIGFCGPLKGKPE